MFRGRLNGVRLENGFDSQHGPDLAALFRDDREANIFICETAPGDLAKRGQRGTKFWRGLASESAAPTAIPTCEGIHISYLAFEPHSLARLMEKDLGRFSRVLSKLRRTRDDRLGPGSQSRCRLIIWRSIVVEWRKRGTPSPARSALMQRNLAAQKIGRIEIIRNEA